MKNIFIVLILLILKYCSFDSINQSEAYFRIWYNKTIKVIWIILSKQSYRCSMVNLQTKKNSPGEAINYLPTYKNKIFPFQL